MDQELISQTALDQMVSSDQTQLIKAAVPYLPPSARQIISLYEIGGIIQHNGAVLSRTR